ncbi:transcription antitermination factor NusB [Marivita sp. XM-24bin2]|uniref:RsmB/NOP family class I SAM-dependent RNA methyltransferase n=1 Tax=unclassified Marivita TaxID=2632480 RepID=UPI000D796C34|nr:transcription antitermination factor NusB [Marivita sp. XM-24bin2]MCR9110455.1 methyltransferase domain-containing protein [Paracoccaceae bacterium]PWL36841.1 MAG: 16S rRNA methyltransferase [Marivita sp. XM-24bin2]
MPAPTSPRLAALDGLSQIIGEGRMLSDVITDAAWHDLSPAERATAQRLVTETLRFLGRADHLLTPHLNRQPPLRVMNLLRMATVELMSGGAAHGVVNEAVNLAARNRKTAPMKGLVNAVLRKVTAMDATAWDTAPETMLPKWLRPKLAKAWSKPVVAQIERAHAVPPPVDLSVKSDAADWAERLGGTVLPTGSVRLASRGQLSALPGFETGDWWVQDAAAALPVQLLGDVTGKRVLDICAAPGGKTMQLAAKGAEVTALDISEARMTRLTENLTRTKLTAKTVVADALKHQDAPFDAILLDAPCSATGTIRRHPDLPYVKTQTGIDDLVKLQRALLLRALEQLKPGGTLVYCTCSLLREEGEDQVKWLLSQNSGIAVQDPEAPGLDPKWISAEGGVRLRPDYWPDLGGMDGFYMAVLQHTGKPSPA